MIPIRVSTIILAVISGAAVAQTGAPQGAGVAPPFASTASRPALLADVRAAKDFPAAGDSLALPLRFKFRVRWDNSYIAGVSKVSPLRVDIEVIEHREGGDPNSVQKTPGQFKYEPITLERSVTRDDAFEEWARQVLTGAAAIRKDIRIEILNETGAVARAYVVHRCWVSRYQALPSLDANGEAVLSELIRLENEGWERDASVRIP